MGARLIAGLVALVIVVVLAQTFVFGGGNGVPGAPGRSGTIPTATAPAQLPNPILLGSSTGATGPSGATNTTAGTTYTVKAGDTLGTIAASFNVPADQQAAWIADVLRINGIADARLLQAGQELTLPGVPSSPSKTPTGATGATGVTGATGPQATRTPAAGSTGSSGATPTRTPAATSGGGASYTVVAGDNPYVIADKFCVTNPAPWVNELLALNNIDASNLKIGQVLELPTGTPAQCKQ
jgi:LysM repeat protein